MPSHKIKRCTSAPAPAPLNSTQLNLANQYITHAEVPGGNNEDLRFSKIKFDSSLPRTYSETLPLTAANFPLTTDTFDKIRYSTAVSPVLPDDINVKTPNGIPDMIENVMGGYPSHPGNTERSDYWVYFRHVLELQLYRRDNPNGLASEVFPVPDLWKDFTVNDAAAAVHDEYPGYWQSNLIAQMLRDRETRIDPSIIPQRANTDFVNSVVCLAHMNTWSIDAIAATSFAIKWHVGRIRPEEAAYKIHTGEMNAASGVPQDIIDSVKRLKFKDNDNGGDKPEAFTAYPEGCPPHPSWPAMHSAGSTLSLWMAVICDMTDEQLLQAKLTDHAVAYSRSVAGVHYYDDNLAGLNLGQEIIANLLPEYLHNAYGSDPDVVRRKVEKYRFDWFEFDETLFQSMWHHRDRDHHRQ
jgi:hypothetical protein